MVYLLFFNSCLLKACFFGDTFKSAQVEIKKAYAIDPHAGAGPEFAVGIIPNLEKRKKSMTSARRVMPKRRKLEKDMMGQPVSAMMGAVGIIPNLEKREKV